MEIKGFKVFNKDWTCGNKQYTCPGEFEEDVKLEVCGAGMHFCKQAKDCFNYYSFDPENKVAEVIAVGDVKEDGDECCTDKLIIVREIPWLELLTLVNLGKGCTGFCNTGNRNTGDWNTGDWNTGDWNTGDWNTGNRNTGNRNTGNRNTGDWNTGDWNQSDFCTGDFNIVDNESGCFCTEPHTIRIFDQESNITFEQWRNSSAYRLLCRIDFRPNEWVYSSDMTDDEKKAHPEHETTGGYLKVNDTDKAFLVWWNNLSSAEKETIKKIPNFNPEKFLLITGIKV